MKKKYSDEQLIRAVHDSETLQQVLDKLNLIGGHARIKEKILQLQLDTSHWKNFSGSKSRKILPLEKLLKNNTSIQTSNLKSRLVNNEYLDYKCSICGISEWNNKYLSLQLDHINGRRKDNRLENLRLLCPNCHSQTETFCGKNIKGIKRKRDDQYVRYPCVKCGKLLQRYQNKLKMCPSCRKTEYGGKLSQEQLIKLYTDYDSNQLTLKQLCKKYDIGRTTVYNLLKRRH